VKLAVVDAVVAGWNLMEGVPARAMTSQADEARGGRAQLFRMVLANRPWWLLRDLSGALAAALATAAFSVVTYTVWGLGDRLDWPRLVALSVLSTSALAIWLIISHDLWERQSGQADRDRIRLANAVTALTLLFGIACLYAALFVLVLVSALLVIDQSYLQSSLGHPVGLGDYATLAWLAASLATIGGALGSGLETDESVRKALYRYRPESLTEQARRDSN
jgi:hypothetical protein